MNREQQLFDQLKRVPTELTLEEVNTIISTLPALPPPSKGTYFNLRYLTMLSIGTFVLSFIIVWNEIGLTTDRSKLTIESEKATENIPAFITDLSSPTQKENLAGETIELDDEVESALIKPTAAPSMLITKLSNKQVSQRSGSSAPQLILVSKLPIKALDTIVLHSTTPKSPSQLSLPPFRLSYQTAQLAARPPDTSLENDGSSMMMLEIKPSDPIQKLIEINRIFKSAGLAVEIQPSYNQRKQLLENVLIHFKHSQGMDFELMGIGFEQLQFRLLLNRHQQIHYFTYRFNEEAFTKPVPLYCKGSKTHIYTEFMTGIRGKTNVDLGYK